MPSERKINFFGERLFAYKANLHTHSKTSDGTYEPEKVIDIYAHEGYDVLAFTDHWKTNPVSQYDSMGMTLISGIELHPLSHKKFKWHLLALDVPEDFQPDQSLSVQLQIDAVNSSGGVVFIAHPAWSGFTSADLMMLKNFKGIEIFNTSTRYIGREYNEQLWTEMTDAGHIINAIAVDDMHSACDLFRGRSMILAHDNSKKSISEAIRKGNYYATQGPEFYSLKYENNIFEAEFSTCISALIIADPMHGICGMVPDFEGPGTARKIESFNFNLSNYIAPGTPVRFKITDSSGYSAWTQIFTV